MVTFFGVIFCCLFVYMESTSHKSKPRAVNLALETVIEFDNKDRAYDLKFIDQVQGFLNKVKYVLKKDQNFRRAAKPELKFSDFIKSTLAIINTYEDEDLEKILRTFNEEARKFNYRGCKFHELVQNIPLRRYIGKKLDELKEMPLEDVRDSIDEILKMWNEGKLGTNNEQLLNYLDSLYEDDASESIAVVLNELDLYRRDEKQRASLDVFDIVRKGLRSLIFDHYTNLKSKERDNVRTKLESAWNKNAEENSHNLFNSYLATDMNRFKTTTKEEDRPKSSKEEEEIVKHKGLNKKTTKVSYESDEDDNGTTRESKKEKSTLSSSESEESESSIKKKRKTTTRSHDDIGEESQATASKKKLKLLSIESKETIITKKKHRKQSHSVAKQKTTKIYLKTTASKLVESSVEEATEKDKHLKFKASQENLKDSDYENEKENNNDPKEKTTEFELKTTAALLSSMEKAPKETKQLKNDSQENVKSYENEEEVSATLTTKKRKHKKEHTESKMNSHDVKEKTKNTKSKTKKRSKKTLHNNTDKISGNSSSFINDTSVKIKHRKNRKSIMKPTHESRHAVAFRNFELSDQDATETKALKSTTEFILATDDAQESSDYEVTKKARKSFTTLASNEGMSIESFEAHKNNIRKSNNDDLFHPKSETLKEGVPKVLLNRLSELEKEIKAVKSQMNVATLQHTERQKSEREVTSKIVNRNKDVTTFTDRTTQNYETKTSHITRATKVNNIEESITADFKVITRDRTATTNTFFKHLTESETLAKGTTGRITKTIKFESPNFRANFSENDQKLNNGASDKKIFISVENESPNATFEFLVPFNFSNTNNLINYEVEVVTKVNVESTVKVSNQTLNATKGVTGNEMITKKTPKQEARSNVTNLLHDENNDINDQFDADDLLMN